MKRKFIFHLIITLITFVIAASEPCEEDDLCTTVDGRNGKVVEAAKCRGLKELLKSQRFCGFQGLSALVCCPTTNPVPPLITTATIPATTGAPEFTTVDSSVVKKINELCENFGARPDEPRELKATTEPEATTEFNYDDLFGEPLESKG